MLKVRSSHVFDSDLKLAKKRHFDINLLEEVVNKLANQEKLDAKYKDHPLKGKYQGYRECHIKQDWILVYRIDKNILMLYLFRTGTHSDLF